jgi:predicted glycoside hydrolase/deacetylase ChbG (UPF0249 family)
VSPPASARRGVVLCADDFALGEPVSWAIAELAAAGRLGALGAMTAGARWSGAWALLRDLPAEVSVGLHVNLVEGHGLYDGQAFAGPAALALRAFSGRLDRAKLAAEIDAQWRAFEDRSGRAPDFVDTHQHVHLLAPVREALLDAIAARGGRIPVRSLWPAVGPANSRTKRLAFRLLGAAALARRLDATGLAANRAFGGLQAFDSPASVEHDWREMLRVLPDGALVACHPALSAEPGDAIGPFRVAEYRWLAGEAFAAASRDAGIDWRPGPRARPDGAEAAGAPA